jgi:hypothetical protein
MHPTPLPEEPSALTGIEAMGVISGTSEAMAMDSEDSKLSILFVWFKKGGMCGCGVVVVGL